MSRHVLFAEIAGWRDVLASSGLFVLGVFVGLFVFGALALIGRRWAAVLLIPLALAWVLCNRYVEGPTILALTWSHGITASDLLSAVALLIAGWRLLTPAPAMASSRH